MSLGSDALASLYLGQFSPSFWKWSSDADAIVWADDGTTIVLRAELQELLARLAPGGLPSLSAIVLILAACRAGWRGSAKQVERRLLGRFQGSIQPALATQLGVVREAMEGVAALPELLRRGVEGKAVLVETVLAGAARRLTAEEAGEVVQAFDDGAEPAKPGGLVEWAPPTLAELAEDLAAIRTGVAELDPEALELRLEAGVSEVPHPADVELPDSERVRRLLAFLQDDDELAGLVQVARNLLAAVQVPRPLAAQSDQPVGGVSDISNRGPLHRLLVSELAHDDLTFTVRIATGEALYLRREAPPHQPAPERFLLIDAGIRMWGVSRLYATAVALALAASAGAACVHALRAEGSELVPVDLSTREGLVEHLAAHDTNPQPGAGVVAVQRKAEAAEQAEVLVVTHPNAIKDPAFTQALAQGTDAPLFLASVDAAGGYSLEVRGPRGRKRLAQATLDLQPLLHPADRPELKPTDGLPAIFGADPFPLDLPTRPDARRFALHPLLGAVGVVRDGRLVHWPLDSTVARQLTDQVPAGEFMSLEIDESAVAWLAIHSQRYSPARLALLSVDLGTRAIRRATVQTAPSALLTVTRVGPLVALIYASGLVEAMHRVTGERVHSIQVRGSLAATRGRYFRDGDGFKALTWTGTALRLEPVPIAAAGPRKVLAVWDRQGQDAPWALLENGEVIALSGEPVDPKLLAPGSGWHLSALSPDGHLVAMQSLELRSDHLVLDLRTGRKGRVRDPIAGTAPLAGRIQNRTRQTRKRFHSIGVDGQGRLTLVSRRNRKVRITRSPDDAYLVLLDPGDDSPRLHSVRPFQKISSPPGTDLRLRRASWPDGAKAWLDGRGLLHLAPAAESAPQLSLVLHADGPLAGWTSSFGVAAHTNRLGVEQLDRCLRTFVEGL